MVKLTKTQMSSGTKIGVGISKCIVIQFVFNLLRLRMKSIILCLFTILLSYLCISLINKLNATSPSEHEHDVDIKQQTMQSILTERTVQNDPFKTRMLKLLPILRKPHAVKTSEAVKLAGAPHFIIRPIIIKDLISEYRVDWNYTKYTNIWSVAEHWVTGRHIHPDDAPELGAVIQALAKKKIISADVGYKGTQLKLLLTLEGGQKAAFKPRWYPREHIGQLIGGLDRHYGEIAAFHVGRILEFRRSPIVVGRFINLETEILPVATPALAKTFYKRNNNTCFYGKCKTCKGPKTGVCSNGTILEGALSLWLPKNRTLQCMAHPWIRSNRPNKMKWLNDSRYCYDTILKSKRYRHGPLLLDIIDTAVFDFLIGNRDRINMLKLTYETETMLAIMDNGRSLRRSTWSRLLLLQDQVLTEVLQAVLDQDPIAPVLAKFHYEALDRRLKIVIETVDTCLNTFNMSSVLMEDS